MERVEAWGMVVRGRAEARGIRKGIKRLLVDRCMVAGLLKCQRCGEIVIGVST